jgi:hypothetical protein
MNRIKQKVLAALSEKDMSLWQLFERMDSGEKETLEALKALEKKGLVKTGKKIRLMKKGGQGKAGMKAAGLKKPGCRPLDSKKLLKEFIKATGAFYPSRAEFNQERLKLEDVVKKAAFLDKRLDLDGARIAFLGDDDFCSVAVSLTGKPKSVTVLEIDPKVIKTIRLLSKQLGLGIKCVQHDMRKPLPKRLKRKFDVFVTEPPESLKAMETFIKRGLSLLKGQGCSGYIGLTRLESSGEKWLALQKKLVKGNAFVSDSLRQFESYPLFSGRIPNFEKMPLSKAIFFEAGKPNANWWKAALVRIEIAGKRQAVKGKFYSDGETLTMP